MKTLHRIELDEALRPLFERIKGQPAVLDVGGGQNSPYQGWIQSPSRYDILDSDPASKPDITADAHATGIKTGRYDLVIATEVLEHCREPLLVMREMHRILAKGGICIGSVPFLYPYHGNKDLRDYYRFTLEGVELLLAPFSKTDILPFGSPLTYWGTLLGAKWRLTKGLNPILRRIKMGKGYAGVVFFAQK